jgi:uncharacterized protein GlcG (DUF336 family)
MPDHATMLQATLTLNVAARMIDAAFAESHALRAAPLCIAVVGASGHLLALEREEAAAFHRVEIAIAKATGSIGMGCGGRELMRRASAMPALYAAFGTLVPLLPIPGGVLIRTAEDLVVGAIGISGDTADRDELCAVAGVRAAGFIADIGTPPR